jgi:hypothetical protein
MKKVMRRFWTRAVAGLLGVGVPLAVLAQGPAQLPDPLRPPPPPPHNKPGATSGPDPARPARKRTPATDRHRDAGGTAATHRGYRATGSGSTARGRRPTGTGAPARE